MNNEIKTFKDVKRGDTIYDVMVSNGKVKIFKEIANVQDRINRCEANLAALRTNNFILR